MNQLDASFDRQGVFSSRGGAFSVEMAEIQVHVPPSFIFLTIYIKNFNLKNLSQ